MKTTLSIRIDKELKRKLEERAKKEDRSVSYIAERLLLKQIGRKTGRTGT